MMLDLIRQLRTHLRNRSSWPSIMTSTAGREQGSSASNKTKTPNKWKICTTKKKTSAWNKNKNTKPRSQSTHFLPLTSRLTRPSLDAGGCAEAGEGAGGSSSSVVRRWDVLLAAASRGMVDRWSSRRPDWKRMMREKKSSSGTVGAECVKELSLGRELLWSSMREP